jgi:PhnB protein
MPKAIPAGYHSVTPYLTFKDAGAAIDWYARAFGAIEEVRMRGPGGSVAHAEIAIGDSRVMLADENPTFGNKSAQSIGGSPVAFMLYLEDVDAAFAKAVQAGAKVVRTVQNQFYGDRSGTLEDPFGLQWTIGTHIEDVSPEEMKRRMQNMIPPQS